MTGYVRDLHRAVDSQSNKQRGNCIRTN